MGRRIAEYVLAHLLAEHQHVAAYAEDQRARRWQTRQPGLALGERALILGTGAIGREIATVLLAAGLEVHGVASAQHDRAPFASIVNRSAALAMSRHVDWLIAALPLTTSTRNFVDAELLGAFPGTRLINVGRGATVVEDDVLAALADGTLLSAVLDVLVDEPPKGDSHWWTAPRTRLTPHVSGPTLPEDVAGDFARCWSAFIAGQRPQLQVDPRRGY
jgi:phosphoglycerate dehydrogenase-like enzyme